VCSGEFATTVTFEVIGLIERQFRKERKKQNIAIILFSFIWCVTCVRYVASSNLIILDHEIYAPNFRGFEKNVN